MRLGLIGYGKMGREVEVRAKEAGLPIAKIIDSKSAVSALAGLDLCIDFSRPDAVLPRLKQCADAGVSLVVGTTGWYEQMEEVKRLVAASQIGFLYAENFSPGMALFVELIRRAGTLINHFPEYDYALEEAHHSKKLDSPSGSALRLAKTFMEEVKGKKPEELSISSIRCGSIPGTHSLLLDAAADTITLTHTARNRSGFALGAIKAAQWLYGRKGFYHFSEVYRT